MRHSRLVGGECTSECFRLENQRTISVVETFDGQSGNKLLTRKHYFYGFAESAMSSPTDYPSWRAGREYRNETLAPDGTILKRVETDFQQRAYVPWWNNGCTWNCPSIEASPPVDPRITEVRTIDVPANQVSKVTFAYDEFNNITDVWQYDIGNGAAASLIRYSHAEYLRGDYIDNYNVSSPHLRRLPLVEWTASDPLGNVKQSLTRYEYDNYSSDAHHASLAPRANTVGHDSYIYGPENSMRGNVTKLTRFSDAQNETGPVSNYSQYDTLGNQVRFIDAKDSALTVEYEDNFGAPDGEARANSAPVELNGQKTFAFATSKTQELGYRAYIQFDYWTGAIVNTEDINEVITKISYDDPLDRMTRTVSAVGTSKEIQSNVVYDDENNRLEERKDLFALNDNLQKTETFSDDFGRLLEKRTYEGTGYVSTKREYDIFGRLMRESSPFRPSQSEQPLWSENFYDTLGRITRTRTPDGAETISEYSGNTITVTDPAGKKRRTIYNVLNEVVRIDEPDNLGSLGPIDNPVLPTNYYYNAIGKLIKVSQGVQSRFYLFDSLGQMIRAKVPEKLANPALILNDPLTGNSAWSTGYTYDPNGNIVTSTNANNITATNTYDALNRVLSITYSDSTPALSYMYDDPNVAFSKNKLTRLTNGVSTTEYLSYDASGMLLTNKQITDGREYTMSYSYDLTGNIVEQVYPSGRTVKTSLDENGAISTVESRKSPSDLYRIYGRNFVYAPNGLVLSMRLGNGLFETTKLNNSSQIIEIGLGHSLTTADVWKVNYDFGTTTNNGNPVSQSISLGSSSFIQTYEYDSLNRLTESREVLDSVQTWKQNFGYDRYGNRIQFSQFIGSEQLPINNLTLPQVDSNRNQFLAADGYEYDANGNLIRDALGRQFSFDAKDNQTLVRTSGNELIGEYFYDGAGKRVKKVTPSETVIYVYNAVGQLIAEYSTESNPNPRINYLTQDIVRSPRVLTDAIGQVISKRDFMPFGEEISRSSYGTDTLRQRFTGYERDSETGLDFAQARMFKSLFGRFLSTDPIGPVLDNPQALHRYQYCFNNPLRCVDKSGGFGRDVHLHLTMALAYAAGFSMLDSLVIGIWAQNPDDDPNKDPLPAANFNARATHHFTSEWQRIGLWQKFKDKNRSSERDAASVFEALGDYLHALQDSFSHEGLNPVWGQAFNGFDDFGMFTPVIPYFCGGGGSCLGEGTPFYDAASRVDVASYRPTTTLEMARQTYDALLEARDLLRGSGYAQSHSGFLGVLTEMNTPLKFEDIREALVKFIEAPKSTDEEIEKATNELMLAINAIREQNEGAAAPDPRPP